MTKVRPLMISEVRTLLRNINTLQFIYTCDEMGVMDVEPGLAAAAQLFKVLGSEPRLELLRMIGQEPRTVGALADATGLSQPLVSQHLRTLRQAGLLAWRRSGKEVTYRLADLHVSHVISDAIAHVQEPAALLIADEDPSEPEHKESS